MSLTFPSAADLAHGLERAAAAHHTYEQQLRHADPDWPTGYAGNRHESRRATAATAVTDPVGNTG